MPRYLCFVDEIDLSKIMPDDDVAREMREDEFPEYVFVSYTRAQFHIGDKNKIVAHRDRIALLKNGIEVAQAAKVNAFLLDCFPLLDTAQDKEDVYCICDITRAAESMIIAIDSSKYAQGLPMAVGDGAEKEALRDWGKRLCTLPELLLCTSHRRVEITIPTVRIHPTTTSVISDTSPGRRRTAKIPVSWWTITRARSVLLNSSSSALHIGAYVGE